VSDTAASAAQTDLVESVFVEAGEQPLAPLEIRAPQTGDKPAKTQTINERPRPVPDVPLGKTKNKPARFDSPDASAKPKPCIPNDFQRGQEM